MYDMSYVYTHMYKYSLYIYISIYTCYYVFIWYYHILLYASYVYICLDMCWIRDNSFHSAGMINPARTPVAIELFKDGILRPLRSQSMVTLRYQVYVALNILNISYFPMSNFQCAKGSLSLSLSLSLAATAHAYPFVCQLLIKYKNHKW